MLAITETLAPKPMPRETPRAYTMRAVDSMLIQFAPCDAYAETVEAFRERLIEFLIQVDDNLSSMDTA